MKYMESNRCRVAMKIVRDYLRVPMGGIVIGGHWVCQHFCVNGHIPKTSLMPSKLIPTAR